MSTDRPSPSGASSRQSYTPVNPDEEEYFSDRPLSASSIGRKNNFEMTSLKANNSPPRASPIDPPGNNKPAKKSSGIGTLKISKAARESGEGVAPKRGGLKKINKQPR